MQSLQEGAVARLGFCGACPTETETSRRGAGFDRFFLAYKPIYMDCTLLHNDGRSTVWYAYPKEERAVILRDPLLLGDISRTGLLPSTSFFAGMLFVVGSYTLDHHLHPLVQSPLQGP